jgi:hypothetical protein
VESFAKFVKVAKGLPQHLEEQISSAIGSVKNMDAHKHKVKNYLTIDYD